LKARDAKEPHIRFSRLTCGCPDLLHGSDIHVRLSRISRSGGARRRGTPAFAANKRQVSPGQGQSMGKPPSGYSTAVAILLPTDEQLATEPVAKLKPANDLNVARISRSHPKSGISPNAW
jgi:hypothetical protein